MLIRRTRVALPGALVLAVAMACGKPPMPVESTPPPSTKRELPPGHPTPTPAPKATADDHPDHPGHENHAEPASGAAQMSAEEFHFAGWVRISDELHGRPDAAVFLSVRDPRTNELVLSGRYTMRQFQAEGEMWALSFELDDTDRMMGGTSRPRDVVVKALYTPGGMLPPIGSTQPMEGAVSETTAAKAGDDAIELVLD